MSDSSVAGTFVFSIDVPSASMEGMRTAAATTRLLQLLEQRKLPATWGVSSHELSSLARRASRGRQPHEFALLCQPQWLSEGSKRSILARALGEATQAAAAQRIPLTTLVLQQVDSLEHLDLLVRHRISMVRGRFDQATQRALLKPQLLRYGIWNAPVSFTLGESRPWSMFGSGVRGLASKATRDGEFVHVVVNAQRLDEVPSQWKFVEKLADAVSRHRDAGRLRPTTLAQLGCKLKPPQASPKSRSVLRVA